MKLAAGQDDPFSGMNIEEWLEAIMDEYGDRLTKLAYSYLYDWGKSEEIVQDVFITCYELYETRYEIKSFKAWVYRVTINRCKDVLKSSWIKRVIIHNNFFKNLKSNEMTPEFIFMQKGQHEQLTACVLALPVKYREVILLFYYADLSLSEISELLELNPNTVKTRLKRGRDMVGNLLGKRDSDEG